MISIDDQDIEFAAKILSSYQQGEEISFDEERRNAIREMESCDVQACPGSGKTTVLHAKLLALSRKYPFPSKRHVCILTHTNVAIDEIRRKLSFHAEELLEYPNFCGTIQQFTNRFLAIPWYVKKFGKRPYSIDDEEYNLQIEKRILRYPTLNSFLNQSQREPIIRAQSYRYSLRDFFVSENITSTDTTTINLTKPSGKQLIALKSSLLKEGYLCYDDAYSLAFEYLRDLPQIIDILRSRFQYILIDEMQDSSSFQQQLIDKIFLSYECIIQRYGDKNQTIYHKEYDQEREPIWGGSTKNLTINSSKRFSNIIGRVSRNVCTSPHDKLMGNPKVPDITPTIIIYDHSRIKDVIPEFAMIAHQYKLVSKDSILKAVGGIKKAKDAPERYCILDYMPDETEQPIVATNMRSITLPQFRKEVFEIIRKSLRKGDVRYITSQNQSYYYSASKLEVMLKEQHPIKYYELMGYIIGCYELMPKVDEIKVRLINYLCQEILPLFNAQSNDAVLEYLKDITIHINYKIELQNTGRFTTVNVSGAKVGVELSTIHGVKGETHTATLFLETYKSDYDITKLMPFLQGKNADRSKSRISGFLRQGYVAMTRPSHFLCLAVHRKHTTTNKNGQTIHQISENDIYELKNQGWEIIQLLDRPQ